jgi:hypothetical protein
MLAFVARWLLFRGGRYSEVAVSSGLTVFDQLAKIKVLDQKPLD